MLKEHPVLGEAMVYLKDRILTEMSQPNKSFNRRELIMLFTRSRLSYCIILSPGTCEVAI